MLLIVTSRFFSLLPVSYLFHVLVQRLMLPFSPMVFGTLQQLLQTTRNEKHWKKSATQLSGLNSSHIMKFRDLRHASWIIDITISINTESKIIIFNWLVFFLFVSASYLPFFCHNTVFTTDLKYSMTMSMLRTDSN